MHGEEEDYGDIYTLSHMMNPSILNHSASEIYLFAYWCVIGCWLATLCFRTGQRELKSRGRWWLGWAVWLAFAIFVQYLRT